MSNYLSKEEIRRWRSSLEKMTLEEYAQKLGKTINTEKETNDIVDMVMGQNSLENMTIEEYKPKAETIRSIAQKALNKEKELINKYNTHVKMETQKAEKKASQQKNVDKNEKFVKKVEEIVNENNVYQQFSFKKPLTEREKAVFDYFKGNTNKIIYAKDLAALLGLPRDYIYKYIKTLRNKLETDAIHNAENGGFMLELK